MSTEQKSKETPLVFEAQVIESHKQWFDPIGIRYISNMTDRPLKVGFTHDIRTVEMIGIFDLTEEDLKSEKSNALIGEIVEEE